LKDTYPPRLVRTDPVRTGPAADIKIPHCARTDSRGSASLPSGHRRSAAAPHARAPRRPPRPSDRPGLRERTRDVRVGPSRPDRPRPRARLAPRPGAPPGGAHPSRPARSLVITPAGHQPGRLARRTDRVTCERSAPDARLTRHARVHRDGIDVRDRSRRGKRPPTPLPRRVPRQL